MPAEAAEARRQASGQQARFTRSVLGRWPGGLALVLLGLVMYAPGLRDLPPVDRDESRFAQASRQMLDSGALRGWVVPMVGDRPRLSKPPVIYWLQAASAAGLGENPEKEGASSPLRRDALERNSIGLPTGGIWRFRVPSLLAAIIAVLLTWRIGLALWPGESRTAWLGGALLGCSLIVSWEARQARADMVLLAITTAAMWALWRCWTTPLAGTPAEGSWTKPRLHWTSVACLWILLALGILTKGPITPMVVVLTAVAMAAATRRWRWLLSLRPTLGLGIVALIVLPWVILVAHEVGWRDYLSILRDEVLGRSVRPAEGHWGPPGYHLVLLPVLLWPGSMLTAAGLVLAWRRLRENRAEDATRRLPKLGVASRPELFLLAWLGPAWIVFELAATKLPHYTMPLYPALALLSARAVRLAGSSAEAAGALGLRSPLARIGLGLWVVIGMVIVSVLPTALARAGGMVAPRGWMVLFGALVGVGGGLVIAAGLTLRRGGFGGAQALGVAGGVVGSALTVGIVAPRLSATWLSSHLVAAAANIDPAGSRPIAAVGYQEDSLVFLTNGRVARLGVGQAGTWLAANPRGIVMIPPARAKEVEEQLGRMIQPLASVKGFNYSKWRWEDLILAEADGDPD